MIKRVLTTCAALSLLVGGSVVSLSACSDSDDPTAVGADALELEWGTNGSATAIGKVSSSSTVLNLSLTGATQETVEVGANTDSDADPTTINLSTRSGSPSIVAGTFVTTEAFVISHAVADNDETYDTFTEFVGALSKELTATTSVVDVAAMGSYDSKSNIFTANAMAVLIND